LAVPAALVAALGAVGVAMGWFGFEVTGPPETMDAHVAEERAWHEGAESVHAELETVADTVHADLHSIEGQLQSQQVLMEAVVIRSCLRDEYEELVLQRLLPTCRQLGVQREPGSRGARDST
jgi:hypothetical protein